MAGRYKEFKGSDARKSGIVLIILAALVGVGMGVLWYYQKTTLDTVEYYKLYYYALAASMGMVVMAALLAICIASSRTVDGVKAAMTFALLGLLSSFGVLVFSGYWTYYWFKKYYEQIGAIILNSAVTQGNANTLTTEELALLSCTAGITILLLIIVSTIGKLTGLSCDVVCGGDVTEDRKERSYDNGYDRYNRGGQGAFMDSYDTAYYPTTTSQQPNSVVPICGPPQGYMMTDSTQQQAEYPAGVYAQQQAEYPAGGYAQQQAEYPTGGYTTAGYM